MRRFSYCFTRPLLYRSHLTKAKPRYGYPQHLRGFSRSASLQVEKPFILADIGEGIREVQIIQWFVKPGARVEEYQKLCEVQSDKAVTEITSRFDGIITKLHYDADDMAKVGLPLCDIDIQSELSPADEAFITPPGQAKDGEGPRRQDAPSEDAVAEGQPAQPDAREAEALVMKLDTMSSAGQSDDPGRHRTLSTPAVRHLTKELNINIVDVQGTGKNGRVLREDVLNHQKGKSQQSEASSQPGIPTSEDTTVPLSPVQSQMFRSMTKSLQIPHFLYSDSLDFTNLNLLRKTLVQGDAAHKISALAFIVKAVSLSITRYPIINARLDMSNSDRPQLHYRGTHNIGIAVDTPSGLLVPVIKSVQSLSIQDVAAEIARLGAAGREGKLTNADLTGGTITVSNVGSIGGGVVSPVIVEGQSAIIGVGKVKTKPAFDGQVNVVRREECVLSWSADHRFVDGATVARAAELVRKYLEQPAEMVISLR